MKLILILFALQVHAAMTTEIKTETATKPAAWEELGTQNGIQIFRQEVPDNQIYAYRGEGEFDVPMTKLFAIMNDISRHKEWVNHLSEARVLRDLGPYKKIIYLRVHVPALVISDRDFVVEYNIKFDAKKKSILLSNKSVEDTLMPEIPGCVRAKVLQNEIILTDVDPLHHAKTQVSAEAHVDPRGSIPKWIVNMFQKHFPSKTLTGLLAQAKKPDIDDSKEKQLTIDAGIDFK